MSQTHVQERKKSKRQYEKVISVVHHQTSPKQDPMVEKGTVNRTCCVSGDLDPATVETKLNMAVKNGDLIESNDRYCVVDDLGRLQRAVDAVVEQVPVDQTLLGELNTEIMQLKEAEDDE